MEPQNTPPLLAAPLIGPTALLRYAWEKYKANWKIFISIIILPYAVMFIGNGLVSGERTFSPSPLIIIGVVLAFAGVIFSIAAYAGLLKTVRDLDQDSGAPISVKDQYVAGFKLFWPLVLLAIIQNFVLLGSMALFIIPGIIVGVYLMFGYMSLIIDGKRGFAALVDSFSIVRGRWFGVLGRIVFIGVINLVLSFVILGIRHLLGLSIGYKLASSPDVFVSLILEVALAIFFIPLAFVYLFKLYESLKQTSLPDAPVVKFKRWLVAFLVVGIVVLISIPIFVIGSL